MRQCFLSLLPMQLGILQISLNSFAICSHISEVGTVLCILVSVPSKWLFPDSRAVPCNVFFPTRESIPKTQVIPHWQDTWNRLYFSDSQKWRDKWHNWSNYTRERRKSKEKISGSGATVRGKWSFYGVMNFFWSNTCSVELWKYSRDSNCNLSFIHWSRWNWNGQFWTAGRRKYNSWSETGRRVE